MRVRVNGGEREVRATSVIELLEEMHLGAAAVVVERNGAIVPRDRRATTPLVEGDVLELVRLVGGG